MTNKTELKVCSFEIKPIAYFKATKEGGNIIWSEDCCCEDPVYPLHDDDETFSLPVYSAAAYEALQKENADLQLRLDAKTLSHQLMLDRTLGLQKENDDQKRKIIGLENELVEWNEFKKIRDAQMQALRKQMP